jgi:hypothetical protein
MNERFIQYSAIKYIHDRLNYSAVYIIWDATTMDLLLQFLQERDCMHNAALWTGETRGW